jgi:hypothetical protein
VNNILNGITPGSISILVGECNIGKTTLALNLSIMAAAGRPYGPFILEEQPGIRAAFLTTEESPRALQERLQKMVRYVDAEEGSAYAERAQDSIVLPPTDWLDGAMTGAQRYLERLPRTLIVLDGNALALHFSVTSNLRRLSAVLREYESCALFVYTNVARGASPFDFKGASSLSAAARLVMELTPPDAEKRQHLLWRKTRDLQFGTAGAPRMTAHLLPEAAWFWWKREAAAA